MRVVWAMNRSTQGMAAWTEPETGGEASAIRNIVVIWRPWKTMRDTATRDNFCRSM